LAGEGSEQLGREVQAGGGRGDGDLAGAISVNGLVTLDVARTLGGRVGALDVGRERDVAEAVGDIDDRLAGGRGEADERGALGVFGEDGAGEVVAVGKGGADGKFFAGADKAPPDVVAVDGIGAEEEALDHTAGGPIGVEPSREDGGVITKEGIAGAQKVWKIGKRMVSQGAVGAINDKETRGIATRGRRLRDEVRRQVVIEEIGRKRHRKENEACDC